MSFSEHSEYQSITINFRSVYYRSCLPHSGILRLNDFFDRLTLSFKAKDLYEHLDDLMRQLVALEDSLTYRYNCYKYRVSRIDGQITAITPVQIHKVSRPLQSATKLDYETLPHHSKDPGQAIIEPIL